MDTNFFFNVGIIKNDDSGLPSTNLATDIDQYGIPAAKFVVPSSGSTPQYAFVLGMYCPPSSLSTPSSGAIEAKPSTIVLSLHKSQLVINDPSALLLALIFPKSFICR